MPQRKKSASNDGPEVEDETWLGARLTLPSSLDGDGGHEQPDMLIWAQEDGEVLGTRPIPRHGGGLDVVADHLRATMDKPGRGPRRKPRRVTVSCPSIAHSIRTAFPDIEVVCAPTPQLDRMLEAINKRMLAGDEPEPSYLRVATPAAVASFFSAAADYFRARPWEVLPSNRAALGVHCGALYLQEAVVSVLGQGGPLRGLLLFSHCDHFDDYLSAAVEVAQGGPYRVPPHGSLLFERGADLPLPLRKEVIRHGWDVADALAYPWPEFVDANLAHRGATEDELVTLEAILRAITRLIEKPEMVRAAFMTGGASFLETFTVRTSRGPMAVTLYAPHETDDLPRVENPLAALAALADVGDPDKRLPLEDQLIEELSEAPEGRRVKDPVLPCQVLMDLAAGAHGVTIAHLGPKELEDTVFNVVPRNIVAPPSMADPMLRAWRALYRYLGRVYAHPQSDACLKVLGRNARKRLEAAFTAQEAP